MEAWIVTTVCNVCLPVCGWVLAIYTKWFSNCIHHNTYTRICMRKHVLTRPCFSSTLRNSEEKAQNLHLRQPFLIVMVPSEKMKVSWNTEFWIEYWNANSMKFWILNWINLRLIQDSQSTKAKSENLSLYCENF